MIEYEKKRMLTPEDYFALCELFRGLPFSETLQTNYYYDTPDGHMRYNDITVRIRQNGGMTVGTVKKHNKNGINTETVFSEGSDIIPEYLTYDGLTLEKLGSLTTCRRTYVLYERFGIMLDKNHYLGKTDLELELEYPPDAEKQADGILLCLQAFVGNSFEGSLSKSERFARERDEIL